MQEQIRNLYDRNCMYYILTYTILGIISGMTFDILVTYLMAVSPSTSGSIASLLGASAFGGSLIAAPASRIGYKKLMIPSAAVVILSLFIVSFTQNLWLLNISLLVLLTGSAVFDVMAAPFISSYTVREERMSMLTRLTSSSMLGVVLGTFSGGPAVVWVFSRKLNIEYAKANILTENIKNLSPGQYLSYVDSYRAILLVFALVSLLMLLPVFLVKEPMEELKENQNAIKAQHDSGVSVRSLLNKYVLLFLVYMMLQRFAASLIAPQVSLYLTEIGINRSTISILGTFQFVAAFIFMSFSPRIVKKLGQVYTISLLYLTIVPFMLVLANGHNFGSGREIIVGIALLFRTGLANATTPVVNSLTMELVPTIYRSLYASITSMAQSLAQILIGFLARLFIFSRTYGYANAYYFAALIYVIAHALLLAVFSKSYNKPARRRNNISMSE